jgi:hypothetical protein
MSFIQYLQESADDESKLVHLKHVGEHAVDSGEEGFKHAFHTLNDVHDAINGSTTSPTKTTIKYDGSPSIIFGRHPKNGKFFVASKSAFNKEPKINYTHEDIEKNHGHAPGLVEKLKAAHTHLQKVAPKKGVFQGDIMYTREHNWNGAGSNDVKDHGGKYHFTPNTITYSQSKDSKEGKKIAKAIIGVAVHTEYRGAGDLENMHAHYGFNAHEKDSGFENHPDVHLLPTHVVHAAKPPSTRFQSHMKKAVEEFEGSTNETHNAIDNHRIPLKTYINSTVRTGAKRSITGYQSWLKNKHQGEVDKLKTPAGKARRQQAMDSDLAHVQKNKHHFQRILNIHDHLENAKDELVHHLSALDHHGYEHSIHGKPSKPEGFVAIRNNRPTKLVDRADFSKANFLKAR